MEQQKLYSLSPNEDVTIINLRSKLLILENACINREMMNSYVSIYHGGQVQAIHRSMADRVSLSEALASVGLRCIGLPWSTGTNPKMDRRLTGPIKTGLAFKLSIMLRRVQLYRVLIYKIHRLLLFQVSKYFRNKST